MSKLIVYSINSRVIWTSEKVYHVPVLTDLYRVHCVNDISNLKPEECFNYTVKFFHKYVQEQLIHSPLKKEETSEVLMNHQKMKSYEKLCDFINASYLSGLPPLLGDETEKVFLLSESLIDVSDMNQLQIQKHNEFVGKLFSDKKNELKKRYLKFVLDIKNAKSLEEVQKIDYSIVYEGLSVI